MLRVDLRAVLDDVDQRHGVAATETVFLLQPVDDDTRLGVGAIETLFFGALDELARGEPGLVLDVVEIRLERHGRVSIGVFSRQIMLNYVNGPGAVEARLSPDAIESAAPGVQLCQPLPVRGLRASVARMVQIEQCGGIGHDERLNDAKDLP